jgi:flagellar protein FlbT
MPLKLVLKPHEKLIVNGAVVSNSSPRTVTLTFHNKAQLLQQKDVLLPEEATTPLLRTYFALQSMYLDSENAAAHRQHFVALSDALFAATKNAKIRGAITVAIKHAKAGEFYRALTALREAVPTEAQLLAGTRR